MDSQNQSPFPASLAIFLFLGFFLKVCADRTLEVVQDLLHGLDNLLTTLHTAFTPNPSDFSPIPPQTRLPLNPVVLWTTLSLFASVVASVLRICWHIYRSSSTPVDPPPTVTPSPPPQPEPVPQCCYKTSYLRPTYTPSLPLVVASEARLWLNERIRAEQHERCKWLVEFNWVVSHKDLLIKTRRNSYFGAIKSLLEEGKKRQNALLWDVNACHVDLEQYPDIINSLLAKGTYGWVTDAIEHDRRASEALEAAKAKARLIEFPPVHVKHPRRKLTPSPDDKTKAAPVKITSNSTLTKVDDVHLVSRNTSVIVAPAPPTAPPHLTPSSTPPSPPFKPLKISKAVREPPSGNAELVSTKQRIAGNTSATATQKSLVPTVVKQHGPTSSSNKAVVTVARPLPVTPSRSVRRTGQSTADDTPSKLASPPGLSASMHSPANRARTAQKIRLSLSVASTPSTPTPLPNPPSELGNHLPAPCTPEPLQLPSPSFIPSPSCACPVNHTHRGCGPTSFPAPLTFLSSPPSFEDDSDCESVASLEAPSEAGHNSDYDADDLCDRLAAIPVDNALPMLLSSDRDLSRSIFYTPSRTPPSVSTPAQPKDTAYIPIPLPFSFFVNPSPSPSPTRNMEVDTGVSMTQYKPAADIQALGAALEFSSQKESAELNDMDADRSDDVDLAEVVPDVAFGRVMENAQMANDHEDEDAESKSIEEDQVVPSDVMLCDVPPAISDTAMEGEEAHVEGMECDSQRETVVATQVAEVEGPTSMDYIPVIQPVQLISWSTPARAAMDTAGSIPMDFQFNLNVRAPVETSAPSAGSWGYAMATKQPERARSKRRTMRMVVDADEDDNMDDEEILQRFQTSKAGMDMTPSEPSNGNTESTLPNDVPAVGGGSSTATEPLQGAKPPSSTDHSGPATVSAAPELVLGKAVEVVVPSSPQAAEPSKVTKVPKISLAANFLRLRNARGQAAKQSAGFAKPGELVFSESEIKATPTASVPHAPFKSSPLKTSMLPPTQLPSRFDGVRPSQALTTMPPPPAAVRFDFNNMKARTGAAAPGHSSTIPSAPILSTPTTPNAAATAESAPRVFKAAPRRKKALFSSSSFAPIQGDNESGMTQAELREALSQESRLEGRGRDGDRVSESDDNFEN